MTKVLDVRCNSTVTTTCDIYGTCCAGLTACSPNKILCSANITTTCSGLRCRADHKTSVCCPTTAQCCESYGSLACCVETDVWWKWPALIASSAFLFLTIALLYYTYRSTVVSRRRNRNVIHFDDILPPQPPPYRLHYPYTAVVKPPYESPPAYTSREATPHAHRIPTPDSDTLSCDIPADNQETLDDAESTLLNTTTDIHSLSNISSSNNLSECRSAGSCRSAECSRSSHQSIDRPSNSSDSISVNSYRTDSQSLIESPVDSNKCTSDVRTPSQASVFYDDISGFNQYIGK